MERPRRMFDLLPKDGYDLEVEDDRRESCGQENSLIKNPNQRKFKMF